MVHGCDFHTKINETTESMIEEVLNLYKKLSEAESGKGLKGRSQRTSGEPLAENVIRQLLF